MRGSLSAVVAVAAGLALAGPARAAGYWSGVAEEVIARIDRAESLTKAGQAEDAKQAVIDSYFGAFEELKMETAERSALGMKRVTEVEGMFNDLRRAAGKGTTAEVQRLADLLRQSLRIDARALDAAKVAADGVAVAK